MEPIFMLLMMYVSCVLYNYNEVVIVFFVLMSAVWLGVFGYVLNQVRKKHILPPLNRTWSIKYIAALSVCSIVNPVLCLFCILLRQPYLLIKCSRLFPGVKGFTNGENGDDLTSPIVSRSLSDTQIFSFQSSKGNNSNEDILSGYTSSSSGSANLENNNIHDADIALDSDNSISHTHNFNLTGSYCDTNPVTGFPMVGGVDICGNPYGTNSDNSY